MNIDPPSKKFKSCPSGCGCTDIRVHFTKTPNEEDAPEKMHLHWCPKCGVGHNVKKGFINVSIIEEMNEVKNESESS